MAPITFTSNSEWADWIQEAANHAIGNGSRSGDTYRRAAKSIRLHPEELHHPNQALVIKGVGEGIVRLITSRLQSHCQANGLPFPNEPPTTKNAGKRKRIPSNTGTLPSKLPRKRRDLELIAEERALDDSSNSDEFQSSLGGFSITQAVRITQKKKVRRKHPDLTPSELALDQSDSPDSSLQPLNSALKTQSKSTKKNSQRASRTKNYIPNRRTGCWGMLVALYILTVNFSGPFTKPEIIKYAQDFCDSSFVERGGRGGGAGNGGHYTAWNMKKLLSEGLTATVLGRPQRFMLTKEGFAVAYILAEKENCDLKEFDKSSLPDGIPKIDLNIVQAGEEQAEEESEPRDCFPRLKSSKTAKPTGMKGSLVYTQIHHLHEDLDTPANREYERQQLDPQLTANYGTGLAHCSLKLEEFNHPNTSSNSSLLPHRGSFQFWYLDRNGARVKKLDEADSRMHPKTFETLYKVEFQKNQSDHPVKRSSIVDEPTLEPDMKFSSEEGWMLIGWMYERKAIPSCPGFTFPSTNLLSSNARGSVRLAELHNQSINHSPGVNSTVGDNLLKPSSSTFLSNACRHKPTRSGRPHSIINDDSNSNPQNARNLTSVVTTRFFSRTSSCTGSMTPVGSFNSVLSDDESSCHHLQSNINVLQPSNRLALKNNSSIANNVGNGSMGSETPIGYSSSDSRSSNETIIDLSAAQSLLTSQPRNDLLKQTQSNLSEITLTQTTSKSLTDINADTLPYLPTTKSIATEIPLHRTPSDNCENPFNRFCKTAENSEPKALESLPIPRTRVTLRRTPSSLTNDSLNVSRLTNETNDPKSVESLPIKRTQVNLVRTCSNLSEKNFHQISHTMMNCSPVEPEVWKVGTYDICLILDYREVRSLDDREAMYNMCQAKAKKLTEKDNDNEIQVNVVQRALVLGDALWVAVNRTDKREVVLDSIVERKRLDDLCSSVKDNRFSEQKARLRRSGLRNPIYLIEAYNAHSNLETHGPMIYSSKSEIMLLNDFQLELTSDWKASVDYLMRRTEVLKELHKKIELTLIPEADIEPTNFLRIINDLRNKDPERYWVTTYKNFEIINNKSLNLTVKELWARMVSCVSGMSTEKVGNFIQIWNTPSDFWNEIQQHEQNAHGSDKFAEKSYAWDWIEKKSNHHSLHLEQTGEAGWIGSRSVSNNSNRGAGSIGPGLSKRIWELFTLVEY